LSPSRLKSASMISRKSGSSLNRLHNSVANIPEVESVCCMRNRSFTSPCSVSQSSLTDHALLSPSFCGCPDALRLRASAAVLFAPERIL
jgi:hypothetical protein